MTRATHDEWRPKNPTWNAPAKGFSHEGSQKADGSSRRISERRLQNGILLNQLQEVIGFVEVDFSGT